MSSCNVTPVSKHADLLRQRKLFLFDEASLIPTHAFHAINRFLLDICNNDTAFLGKVILLVGDFCQALPVVRKGCPAEVVEICLKSSPLWHLVSTFSLLQNMRARAEEQKFAEWLLHIVYGSEPRKQDAPFEDTIQVPHCCVVNEESSMAETMYDGLAEEGFFLLLSLLLPISTHNHQWTSSATALDLSLGTCIIMLLMLTFLQVLL